MPFKKKSSWPLHPWLLQLEAMINAAPAAHKQDAVLKTVERCARLMLKIAIEFDVPATVVRDIVITQIKKEGGDAYLAQLSPDASEAVVAVEIESDAPPMTLFEAMLAAKPKAQA